MNTRILSIPSSLLVKSSPLLRHLSRTTQLSITSNIAALTRVCRAARGIGLGRGRREGLLKVGDDVVNVLRADGDSDEVLAERSVIIPTRTVFCDSKTHLSDAAAELLLVSELLVGGGPGVDGQSLGVADAVMMTR